MHFTQVLNTWWYFNVRCCRSNTFECCFNTPSCKSEQPRVRSSQNTGVILTPQFLQCNTSLDVGLQCIIMSSKNATGIQVIKVKIIG